MGDPASLGNQELKLIMRVYDRCLFSFCGQTGGIRWSSYGVGRCKRILGIRWKETATVSARQGKVQYLKE